MRLSLTVVDPIGGASADVVLDADPESSVGDITRELARHVGLDGGAQIIPIGGHIGGHANPGGAPQAYVDGYPLDPDANIVGSALREGAVVSLHDPAGCLLGEPTGIVEFRVAGGPAAGAVHRLGVGRYDIGSGPAAPIRIDDPELAARAATLSIAIDGKCDVTLHGVDKKDASKKKDDDDDGDRPRLDGEDFDGGSWPLGSQLALGNTLLEIDGYSPPNAALKWSEDGAGLDYNRPPRLRPAERKTQFRLPSPPGTTRHGRCPG